MHFSACLPTFAYSFLFSSFLCIVHRGPFNVFISGSTGTDYYSFKDASRFYPRVSINLVNRAASSSLALGENYEAERAAPERR